MQKIIKAVAGWLPEIVFVAALGLLAGLVYRHGFQTAYNQQQAVIEKIQADAKAKEAAAALDYAEKLKEAQRQADEMNLVARRVEIRALNMAADAQRRKNEHKKGINHAIEQDQNAANGGCIDGLGAHGLRQYRQALGYAD